VTVSVQVSQDDVKRVLGRLQQLGDVVDKSGTYFYDGVDKSSIKDQLDTRSASRSEESLEARKNRKEASPMVRRSLDSNAGRAMSTLRPKEKDAEDRVRNTIRPRDKETDDRARNTVRLYSTIIVSLREKKPAQADSAKNKPAGATPGGQRKP